MALAVVSEQRAGRAGQLGAALHAEWTKLRTVPGPAALLLAAVLLTTGLSAGAAAAVTCGSPGCHQDPVKVALTGITLGQALVAMLAVQLIGGEFGTGMIRSSFAAVPGRATVLAVKAAVLAAVVLPAGLVAAIGSWLTGRILLPGNGFTAANGTELLGPADWPTLRAVLGSGLYLTLVALLALGIAAAARDSAAATGIVLGVLYLFPILISMVSNPDWHRHLQQIAPMNAGLAIQSTIDLDSLPIGGWAGIGVLAAWAAAALLLGGLLLRFRDA